MTNDMISSLTEVFETLAAGANRAEFEEALDSLRVVSAESGSHESFDRITLAMTKIRTELRDRAVVEHGLNMLIETSHDLSGTLSADDLMRLIVRRTRALVGADLAWVTVQEPETSEFRNVHIEGHVSPGSRVMRCDVEHGLVGAILRSKSYFHTTDYLNDDSFCHLAELDMMFKKEGIVSLTGFPLLVGDEVVGFLFAAYRYRHDVGGRELSILGSLALHAAVALRNAAAFKVQAEALSEAEASRTALLDYIGRVEASAETHDEMASLLASGADLRQYLQRMATQVDGAIFLYDHTLRVQEEFVSTQYVGELADRIRADRRRIAGLAPVSTRSVQTGRAQMLTDTGTEECRAIVLHGGARQWEMLVICSPGKLDEIEVRNLERSAVALAIAKLWAEKREAEQIIATSTLIRHLTHVSPPDEASLKALRDRLGIGSGDTVRLALIRFWGLDQTEQQRVVRDCAARHEVLVDQLGGEFLAIAKAETLGAFLSALNRQREEWHVGGVQSAPLSNLAGVPSLYASLRECTAILHAMRPLHRFLDHDEVSLFARIFEGRNAEDLSRHVVALLQPIQDHGPKQGNQLKQTMRSYFENQFNARRTADSLGIHINTVRQRLQTLRDLTGGWDDPFRALEFQVALRLDDILANKE
ncbi:helix-turn-helix domain-containing protein [Sulfitobacter sp. CW3]|uniref:helix-turn-helix domain-containing protein n=1 Tax=Sulfitobacter sp. CW3 TaxID=2861965 RepID=UPI001C5DD6A3|nr:helix-turn-helix domain-containing protein [Sulfitobacter sp. CW3]MBW4963387.1 GAF domain-containing protein [Sulfitobacter sp. CW3]